MQVRGEGRPVVLLPWFGVDGAVMAEAWEPVFEVAPGWRRLYVDLPGTGGSAPVAPRSDAVLDAVEESVRSAVGDEGFLLGGCSYGGYLATGLTRRVSARVAGLILVCTGVRIRPDQRNLSGVQPSSPEPGWLDSVPARLHEHFRHAVGTQSRLVADRIAHALHLNGPIDEKYLEALRSTGYPLSDEASTRSFAGPVTIVAGRCDRLAGFHDLFDALDRFPNGTFVAASGAGHYLPFEQPDRFRSIALDWLAQTALPRAT